MYEFDWDHDSPVTTLPASQLSTCIASLSTSGRFVVSGAKDGQVGIRPVSGLCGVLNIGLHDGVVGQVGGTALSFDDKFVISCGYDGQIFASRILPDELETEAKAVDERVRRKARMARSAFDKTLDKMI